MAKNEVRERLLMDGPGALSDGDLLTLCGAETVSGVSVRQLAWVSVGELRRLGLAESRAVALAAAFELGRRGAWAPPRRGERCLDPQSVYELMRPLAHAPVEEFHVVLLDVRGRLLRTERIAQGSLTQCPVNPRDVFRTAVREAAHGIVFVHNHPSSVMRSPRFGRSLSAKIARGRAFRAAFALHNQAAPAGLSARMRWSLPVGEVRP